MSTSALKHPALERSGYLNSERRRPIGRGVSSSPATLASKPVYCGRDAEDPFAYGHEEIRRADSSTFLHRLAVKTASDIILVRLNEVFWIQSMGNFIRLELRDVRYECRMTMTGLQRRLDPESFIRVHRSAIVNLDHVTKFALPHEGNAFVHMENGKAVPISKSGRSALRTNLLCGLYSQEVAF